MIVSVDIGNFLIGKYSKTIENQIIIFKSLLIFRNLLLYIISQMVNLND
ncbi:hypothetical protein CHRY9390_01563 [Chryseobacterium aquaeductus]|uniref:Uncharacterized protein n=1 Tax=Chryseobacterium aquaeductus TaxID=2675056 RepID=A0A9N8MGT5_9FLAO|nr:hypothetical protein CHRY9390_01563 [Chryseobacterium potabilaquae]CAD7806787.1 hypothetical protein CHRY9390_01563 [Chryseobacterium aquaeductus]